MADPSQSSMLDAEIKLTWRDVTRLGLGTAAEIGVLALIFDSTLALKMATAVIALLGLATLQFEKWLEATRKGSFVAAIVILGGTYIIFLAYAVNHAVQAERIHAQLESIYAGSYFFMKREMPVAPDGGGYDAAAVKKLGDDVDQWRQTTQLWLANTIGVAAAARFLEISNFPALCWGPKYSEMICDIRYGLIMNRLANDRANLHAILESKAYEHD